LTTLSLFAVVLSLLFLSFGEFCSFVGLGLGFGDWADKFIWGFGVGFRSTGGEAAFFGVCNVGSDWRGGLGLGLGLLPPCLVGVT